MLYQYSAILLSRQWRGFHAQTVGFIEPVGLSAGDLRLFMFASTPSTERSVEYVLGNRDDSYDEATKGKLGG